MWKALIGTVALSWLLVTPVASQHNSHHTKAKATTVGVESVASTR
jgi:hypothetical protein